MNSDLETLQRWAMTWLPLLLDAAIKGAILLAVAVLAVTAMRKASAAARQLVWVLALGAMLTLPLVSRALPAWRVLPSWTKLEMPSPPPSKPAGEFSISRDVLSEADLSLLRASSSDGSQEAPSLTADISAIENQPEAATPATASEASKSLSGDPDNAFAWPRFVLAALAVWLAGTITCLLPLVLGRVSLWRLTRASHRVESGSWATLARPARTLCG